MVGEQCHIRLMASGEGVLALVVSGETPSLYWWSVPLKKMEIKTSLETLQVLWVQLILWIFSIYIPYLAFFVQLYVHVHSSHTPQLENFKVRSFLKPIMSLLISSLAHLQTNLAIEWTCLGSPVAKMSKLISYWQLLNLDLPVED